MSDDETDLEQPCGSDCIGYCVCVPCAICDAMGKWTTVRDDQPGGDLAYLCDECAADERDDEDER